MIISFHADKKGANTFLNYSKLLKANLDSLNIPYDIEELPSQGDSWHRTARQKPGYILRKLEEHNQPIVWLDVDSKVRKPLPELDMDYDIAVAKSLYPKNYYHVEIAIAYINNTPGAKEFLKLWTEKSKNTKLIVGDHFCFIEVWNEMKDKLKLVELPSNYANRKLNDDNIVQLVVSKFTEKADEFVTAKSFNQTGKFTVKSYWWNGVPNFGDMIGPYILRFANCLPNWTDKICKNKLLTVGSIIHHAQDTDRVWGSGVHLASNGINKDSLYFAVRGPLTREKILSVGGDCPEIYGDPALILPRIIPLAEKTSAIGIVPHHSEFKQLKKDSLEYKLIDPKNANVEHVVKEISSCDCIIASSLHGLIIAHAYGIPTVWVEFSDTMPKDRIKFADYFASIGYFDENPVNINAKSIDFQELSKTAKHYQINLDLDKLIDACPFPLRECL